MALITKGVTLAMVTYSDSPSFTDSDILPNMTSFPDILPAINTIDVTDLSKAQHTYIPGLRDNGGSMEFGFIYSAGLLNKLYTASTAGDSGQPARQSFQLTFPDGVTFDFSGYVVPAVDGKGVDEALTIRAVVTIDSDIEIDGLDDGGETGPSGPAGPTGPQG